MKKSIRTFLKFAGKDEIARSANPAIVRASTIYFKTMQEMREHQKKITKGKKVDHWDYGRQGSQTTICLLYTSPSPRDRTRSRMPSSA